MATADSDETEQAEVTQNGDETVVEGPNAAANDELPQGTDADYNTGREDAISSGSKQKLALTFGDGTREQVKLKLVGRGPNAKAASEDLNASVKHAEDNNIPERAANLVQEGNAAFSGDE